MKVEFIFILCVHLKKLKMTEIFKISVILSLFRLTHKIKKNSTFILKLFYLMINFDLSFIKRVIDKLKISFQIECGFIVYLLLDL